MATFEYEATQDDGKAVRGTEVGTDLAQVIQSLALRGLLVTKINAAETYDPIPRTFVADARKPETPAAVAAAAYQAPQQTATRPEPSELPQPRSYFATNIWGPLAGQVPLTNLALFFRQHATMTAAAVPPVSALESLAKQEHSPKLATIVREMKANAEQ